ncbi:hypothetical protein NEMBOFW57_002465 [Staphylotrichum longicolle]|uniref:Sugar phosphate transporter domain-containing protein n=1 Tax=Staphylotrichum longicolle TaxID=669026 RepID=A0AAD4F4C1_9PEZI|nr:hypothetical protein NEMBOFW57_002465 [Staphylotrichum longicolle]
MPTAFPSNVPDPDPPPSPDRPDAQLEPARPKDHVSRSLSISTSAHATAVTSGADASPVSAALVAEPWTSANSPSSSVGLGLNDIEMDSVTPSGHRRRRSSLINPANPSNSRHRSPRARSVSTRRPANGDDEDKIVEESSDAESLRPGEVDEDDLTDEDLHDDEEAGLTGKDRRRKRRKRRRNQLLDQRVARDDGISAEEKQEADRNVARSLIINGVLIGLWSDLGQSRHEPEPERPIMTKMFYLTRIGPCGVATGLDIGLGNTSLQFITLTFYTMCKSSSLAFVLLFAFLFRLEVPTWKLVAIIATMTLGVVMMVAGEVEFKLGGFVLVIAAAFFSGFRWGLTQILLLRHPATSNPFSSILFLAPVMFLTLISIAIPVEGGRALLAGLETIAETKGVLGAALIILFPGVIAFLMTASEFALLQRTSVVTLSIAGIFKEAVTISPPPPCSATP